jgi:putative flippase GtrA
MNNKLLIVFCAVFGIVYLLIGINWLHSPIPYLLINLVMVYSVPALSLPEKFRGNPKILIIQLIIIVICSIISYMTNDAIRVINVILIAMCVASYPISSYIRNRK